jgi:hypothetical protein
MYNIPFPIYHNEYPFLDDLLRNGAKMRISLGLGTNLRIIKVTKRGKTLAYGQYPHLAGAFIHAEQDAKDKHPDLFPKEQYHNEKRPHFRHFPSGVKPRSWDDKDILLYELGMYYLHDIEITCKRRKFFIKPVVREDIVNIKQAKKRIRFRIGKGSTIMIAFHNLFTVSILPIKRRRKKTLDMIAEEIKQK